MSEKPNVIVSGIEELRDAVRSAPPEATSWVIECLPGRYNLGSKALDSVPGDPRITLIGHGCIFSYDDGSPAEAWLREAYITSARS
jgi:hypothetical protein